MKTAMQELIDKLEITEKQLDKENNLILSCAIFAAKNMAIELLEKEKEQIIEAYGRAICMFYESEQPEEYYNETFNQNI
jgi:hypothetical protein